jgi:Ca-activated chloride channel family protein
MNRSVLFSRRTDMGGRCQRKSALPAQRATALARLSLAIAAMSAALFCAAAADGKEQVDAYVARFLRDDPDRCFDHVLLERPRLQGPSVSTPREVRPVRVVVAIDGSGSMDGRLGNTPKLELARRAAETFVGSLPPEVPAALLVFGQQGSNTEAGKSRSCQAIDLAVPMTTDRAALQSALGSVQAVGWTPLASALQRAGELFGPSQVPGEQVVYVVSDGEETCGGDPVAAARALRQGGTRAIVNIIGFGIPKGQAQALRAVADAAGGRFTNARAASEVERHLAAVRENNRRHLNTVRAGNAESLNSVRAHNAITRARSCIHNMQSLERTRLENQLALDGKKKLSAGFADQTRARLRERHESMRTRLDAYVRETQNAATGANKAIDADAAAVR